MNSISSNAVLVMYGTIKVHASRSDIIELEKFNDNEAQKQKIRAGKHLEEPTNFVKD